ncbi:hypothetical protein DAMA08_023640 [Martiniozyma asiatica (nom. inval.)]|nr:hypothetical protein DAMA08_023640 [Martiniozyma asiatica]
MVVSKIRSVAVIGGGPAGIACVNELVHVCSNGISTLEKNTKPQSPAFDKIICFEQNSKLGGVWNFFEKPDPKLPSLSILNSQRYNHASGIYEKPDFPAQKTLKNTSFSKPFVKISSKNIADEFRWAKNAAYKDLFTNIPEKYMRFSYTPYEEISKGKFISPLISSKNVRDYLNGIVDKYNLRSYFRTDSGVELVEKVQKEDGSEKWRLTIRHKTPFSKTEQWYQEEVDAVVAANGHCNVPFIPKIENLPHFVKQHPDVVRHSKSFRSAEEFKNQKVLLVGSGTSTADLAQYILPNASKVVISQRSKTVYPWIEECFKESPELSFKPRIRRLLSETKQVEFDDGSVESFDHIILATGYHYHYPFLKDGDEFVKIYHKHDSNGPVSKIGNLFLYTFSTQDNTFATAGIPTIGLMFHAMEYSAAAIAGVFSRSKELPTIEEQDIWDAGRTQISEPEVPHRYQGFFLEKIEEQLLNPLIKLAPEGRRTPLDVDKWNPSELSESDAALIKIYLGLKGGKLKSEDLCK